MYPLLIKDRGYPIHTYLQFMMKEKGVSRKESVAELAGLAWKLHFRDIENPPYNNTISNWLRGHNPPKWAVNSAIISLHQNHWIPLTEQDYAFRALVCHEPETRGIITDIVMNDIDCEWDRRAEIWHLWYKRKNDVKLKIRSITTWPHISSLIICIIMGNDNTPVTMPELFFCLDSSQHGMKQVILSLKNNTPLSMHLMEHVRESNEQSGIVYKGVATALNELSDKGILITDNEGKVFVDKAKETLIYP